MSASHSRLTGVIVCVVSAACYGFLGLFGVRIFATGATLQTMIGWRFLLASVALWAIVRATHRPVIRGRAILQPLLMGAVIYSVQTTLYFMAVQRLSVGLAALLLYTMPAIVVCIEMLRGTEKPGLGLFVAVFLAIGGVAVTMLGPDSAARSVLGVVCGLGSALAYTAYYYGMETMPQHTDPLVSSAWVCTGAAASQIVLGSVLGSFDWTPPSTAMAWMVAMALICTVIALTLLMIGIRSAGPAIASVVSCVEPITSVLLGAAFVGDPFGPAQILGTLGVVVAVAMSGWFRSRAEEVVMEHG